MLAIPHYRVSLRAKRFRSFSEASSILADDSCSTFFPQTSEGHYEVPENARDS